MESQVLTLKIKIENDSDILNTIVQYTGALNYVSTSAFVKQEKVRNAVKLHKEYYQEVRNTFNLPSQMTCSVFRDVARKYKANKRKLSKAIGFKPTHINLVYNRDFTLKDDLLSISTINGRKKINLELCEYHKQLITKTIKYCDSTIVKDRKNQLYFCISIEITVPELKQGNTMGIDLGLTKLAVANTNKNKTIVIKGGKVKDKRNKFLKLRKRLQCKGTKSAKRLLKKLSGKENRYMRDVNFCTVKRLLNFAKINNVGYIGIEDLSGIRNSKLRKEQRRQLNSWAFFQFRNILEYKARLTGINVTVLNPQYTSQACSMCGHTEKANRKTQKHFVCKSCGYSQNADINAAANIEFLTRLLRFNLIDRASVNKPDATGVDAKGLFSQLRRSLVASPNYIL